MFILELEQVTQTQMNTHTATHTQRNNCAIVQLSGNGHHARKVVVVVVAVVAVVVVVVAGSRHKQVNEIVTLAANNTRNNYCLSRNYYFPTLRNCNEQAAFLLKLVCTTTFKAAECVQFGLGSGHLEASKDIRAVAFRRRFQLAHCKLHCIALHHILTFIASQVSA